jgi:hypothetical protein
MKMVDLFSQKTKGRTTVNPETAYMIAWNSLSLVGLLNQESKIKVFSNLITKKSNSTSYYS